MSNFFTLYCQVLFWDRPGEAVSEGKILIAVRHREPDPDGYRVQVWRSRLS